MLTSLSIKNSDPSTPYYVTGTLFGIKLHIVVYPKILNVI